MDDEKMLRHQLATNVRVRRHAAGMTLRKASEASKMHLRHLQKIEASEANVTLFTLARLAKLFGINGADLLRAP